MSLRSLTARARGLELVSAPPVALDPTGDPCAICVRCEGRRFHREPNGSWTCSTCMPPILPPAERQAGWSFCGVPE